LPIRYLTGVSRPAIRAIANARHLGLMLTPDNGYVRQIPSYPFFAVDNGMYGLARRHQENKFRADRFFAWLD
jgi:hypothetical protein